MKLGWLLRWVGVVAVLGGLINTVGGCLAEASLFADPFQVGRSIGTLLLGLVLFGLGERKIQKAKERAEPKKPKD